MARLRPIISACLVGMGLLGAAGPVRAALIPLSDPTFGPNSVLLDTNTGLEWLNLRASFGLSPLQVFAQTQPGGQFAGFNLAGPAQFSTLIDAAFGVPSVCCLVPLDRTTTLNFINFFGPSGPIGGDLEGNVALGPFPNPEPMVQSFVLTPGFFVNADSGFFDEDTGLSTRSGPGIGTFLVRAVPEPTSLALLGAGLVAFGIARRKRSRSAAVTEDQSQRPLV